jgi:hypothetical protein
MKVGFIMGTTIILALISSTAFTLAGISDIRASLRSYYASWWFCNIHKYSPYIWSNKQNKLIFDESKRNPNETDEDMIKRWDDIGTKAYNDKAKSFPFNLVNLHSDI